jgi:hypothetical protein
VSWKHSVAQERKEMLKIINNNGNMSKRLKNQPERDAFVKQAKIRESLGMRPLPDRPEELHVNYNKLKRMGTSSVLGGTPEN